MKIVILGAGPGGYVAALRAAQLGGQVVLIEAAHVGGTCLNQGCIPSKVMITTAEILEKFHRASEFGITVQGKAGVDMPRLMARKDKVIQAQRRGIHALLKHGRIQYINGAGYIKEPGLLAVQDDNGEETGISWDRLILATGTKPLEIPSFPFDGRKVLSSNHALDLQSLPKSILIVGGGVIGCEFAFMLSGLGVQVTIVEAMARLLPIPSVDEACSAVLQREMKKRKIRFMVNRSVSSFEDTGAGLCVTIGPSLFSDNPSEKESRPATVVAEKLLVCVGRQPNTTGIGLENIGVDVDEKGWIQANDKMETSISGVYAIGDILGPSKIMLAHAASAEGMTAAQNAMGGDLRMRYDCVPNAIFTAPEVGAVGMSEIKAKEAGHRVRCEIVLFRNLGKAQVIGEIAGQAKIVSDAVTGKLLGVHIIWPDATNLIAEAALAIRMGGTVSDVAETIHAHPTLAEIMPEACFKVMGRSLHG